PGDRTIRLNGETLALDASDRIPALTGNTAAAGTIAFAPATITFLTIANAGNSNCP
ncbi:hypothetical protein HWN75_26635, partial [Escherichia coli]|nr:hypothetical protein [Escherichia coli]